MAGPDKDDKAVKLEVPKEQSAEEKKKALEDKKKKKQQEDDMSEEDKRKKEEMELLVERVGDVDAGVVDLALVTMARELKSATSSMTSVPKPLKFLRPHYAKLVETYEKMQEGTNKKNFADILSVLATTQDKKEGERPSLTYRLAGTREGLISWGHEYIRNLCGELSAEWQDRVVADAATGELMALVDEIVPYQMKHNAEAEAVDLLCEVDQVRRVLTFADESNCQRITLYLMQVANFASSREEEREILDVVFEIFLKQKIFPDALRVALKMTDTNKVSRVVDACEDRVVKKQLALMMSRQRVDYQGFADDEELQKLQNGEGLSAHFLHLAKELDVLDPKLPEDVYKSHLEEKKNAAATALDSAKQNLASTFVNGFVNAGFCKDSLMTSESSGWLYKNKEHGMMSAAASLGLILLWNVDEGLTAIDKFQWSNDNHVKAGALMAFGLTSTGVRTEIDPAYALLADSLESPTGTLKLGSVFGLGLAYAGSRRQDLLENLTPIIIDGSLSVEVSAMAAVALGLVFVGSCSEDASMIILQALMERGGVEGGLDGALPHMYAVGLGLLYLGQGEACETSLQVLETVEHPIGKYAKVCVESFAHAGSGDVLRVQKLLHICAERPEEKKEEETKEEEKKDEKKDAPAAAAAGAGAAAAGGAKKDDKKEEKKKEEEKKKDLEKEEMKQMYQSVAVMGVPLVGLGEEVGSEMGMRALDRMLQYGELPLRRAVPLAIALQSVSNPKPTVVDTLSKLSHDQDADVALNAILAMGLVGAGSNNSRLAGLLRQLAAYYSRDANALFTVRIAQGLVHMGKGLMTLSPVHSDRFLINPVALGALLVVLHASLFMRHTLLGKQHFLLFALAPAMYPRMLITVDENMNPLPVSVRVGQAVDVVGQAGRPKSITGFQTHTTPVLLTVTDRAELATEQYIPCTNVLEGVVILRPNPNYKEPVVEGGKK